MFGESRILIIEKVSIEMTLKTKTSICLSRKLTSPPLRMTQVWGCAVGGTAASWTNPRGHSVLYRISINFEVCAQRKLMDLANNEVYQQRALAIPSRLLSYVYKLWSLRLYYDLFIWYLNSARGCLLVILAGIILHTIGINKCIKHNLKQ